ncbi:hypothetical protein KIN20_002701 [Parelaphostrongylus tenuis]|uniref:Uncharacterized protein n=1 Tax=Parelaphostrongylus tenuis TaxID=148309 RepID=A0AAD5LYY5_PARTN|nr:hypothetical protein KIN20_002701 [Parelaphostrongylus tenuis]
MDNFREQLAVNSIHSTSEWNECCHFKLALGTDDRVRIPAEWYKRIRLSMVMGIMNELGFAGVQSFWAIKERE